MNNTRKGISQVLFLIIAAAVLMMVAMSLIFIFQTQAGDAADDADQQACHSSIETQCQFGGGTVNAPSVCLDETGVVADEMTPLPGGHSADGGTIDCAD